MKTEIGRLGKGEDAIGEVRKVAFLKDLVAEDPLVPDVHTRVAAWHPGQVRTHIEWKRPREHDRHNHIRR